MVKIFKDTNRARLEQSVNDYAKKNNLRIISTSLAVTELGYCSDLFYFSVVFEEKI